ncbi:FAD-dependent thymidylate synthase [Candidatus Pelagibacter bacterium]|jgi:thymidylate synthase (FAD)|nr:FAD-dependent thymidylate synthase [Candidatus Pelagibacter bacterium]
MSVNLINWSGSNLMEEIAYIARVSNPKNQTSTTESDKLIKYLIKHKHWSPFEMVSLCLEIETTRDIARQILRHRSFSFQEFSQRYASVEVLGDVMYKEARGQDIKNRQNSVRLQDGPIHEEWRVKQENAWNAANTAYKWALDKGIAKEQARAVLPEGMTPSRMYMNGTLRSWIHYINLRSSNGTQKEHMEVAKQCAEAIAPIFPLIEDFVNED